MCDGNMKLHLRHDARIATGSREQNGVQCSRSLDNIHLKALLHDSLFPSPLFVSHEETNPHSAIIVAMAFDALLFCNVVIS